jgi:hypothetical protein
MYMWLPLVGISAIQHDDMIQPEESRVVTFGPCKICPIAAKSTMFISKQYNVHIDNPSMMIGSSKLTPKRCLPPSVFLCSNKKQLREIKTLLVLFCCRGWKEQEGAQANRVFLTRNRTEQNSTALFFFLTRPLLRPQSPPSAAIWSTTRARHQEGASRAPSLPTRKPRRPPLPRSLGTSRQRRPGATVVDC